MRSSHESRVERRLLHPLGVILGVGVDDPLGNLLGVVFIALGSQYLILKDVAHLVQRNLAGRHIADVLDDVHAADAVNRSGTPDRAVPDSCSPR